MGKPRKRTIIEEEIEPETNTPAEYEVDPVEKQVYEDLQQYGPSDVDVKIYKRVPGGRQFRAVEHILPAIEQVQEMFPEGGVFDLDVFIRGTFRHRQTLNIGPKSGSQGVLPGANDWQARLFDQQIQLLREEMRMMRQNTSTPPGELAQAVSGVFQMVGQFIKPPQETQTDTILKVLELGISLGKSGDGEVGWKDIVREALPMVGPMFAGKMAAAPANGNGQPEMLNNPNVLQQLLKDQIAKLKKKALAGSDPELYIAFVADNYEDERAQALIHAVVTQEFSAFTAIDPEIGQEPYLQFFKSIYDGLRSAFAQQNPVVPDSAGSGGDAPDTANDAKPRKTARK